MNHLQRELTEIEKISKQQNIDLINKINAANNYNNNNNNNYSNPNNEQSIQNQNQTDATTTSNNSNLSSQSNVQVIPSKTSTTSSKTPQNLSDGDVIPLNKEKDKDKKGSSHTSSSIYNNINFNNHQLYSHSLGGSSLGGSSIVHTSIYTTNLGPNMTNMSYISHAFDDVKNNQFDNFGNPKNVPYLSLARPLYNNRLINCLCCVRNCCPFWISWQRTRVVRLLLRLWLTLSSALMFVLFIEMFLNATLEYVLTCVIHWRQGSFTGFLFLPMLFLVFLTLLRRYCLQALYFSFKFGSDINGNFESKTNSELKALLWKLFKQKEKETQFYKHINENENENENDNVHDNKENNQENKETATEKEKEKEKETENVGMSVEKMQEYIGSVLDAHKSVIVGDFFVATCWRWHIFVITFIFSFMASISIDSVWFHKFHSPFLFFSFLFCSLSVLFFGTMWRFFDVFFDVFNTFFVLWNFLSCCSFICFINYIYVIWHLLV